VFHNTKTMENENELDLDSQNEGQNADEIDFSDADAAKEAYQKVLEEKTKIADTNKQLYSRAKKAEGFEFVDGKWVKPDKKPDTPVENKPSKEPSKPGELDYGQLAFYNTKSDVIRIESDEDVEFLQRTIKETGKSQGDILKSSWFQNELKERISARESAEAIPKSKPRSGQTGITDVDLAVARYKETGELPKDFAIRNKVVDAITKEEKGELFNFS